jgi:SAM-dependent methyltransferase
MSGKHTPVDSVLDEAGKDFRRALARLASTLPSGDGGAEAKASTSVSVIEADDWEAAVRLWRANGLPLLGTLPSRKCPACQTGESRRLFDSYDGYPYVECSGCGIWYVPLQVDWELFERFREACPEADRLVARTALRRRERLAEQDVVRIRGYLDDLLSLLAREDVRPRYLDIGCGVGHSLDIAGGLGLQSVGVEPDPVSRGLAQGAGHRVVESLSGLGAGQFDLVTLWETLEHVCDPVRLLRDAGSRLASGGLLALSVPNGRASGLRIARERCSYAYGGFDSPGHINFFDLDSMRALFKSAGLCLIDSRQEFSTNLLEVVDAVIGGSRAGSGMPGSGLQENLARWVESLGPEVALFEAMCGTLPMLHCVACRADDEELHANRCAALAGRRAQSLTAAARARLEPLGDVSLPVKRLEAQLLEKDEAYANMHRRLQAEVDLRDRMLREQADAHARICEDLRAEISRRDGMLHDAQVEYRRMHDLLQREVDRRDALLRASSAGQNGGE